MKTAALGLIAIVGLAFPVACSDAGPGNGNDGGNNPDGGSDSGNEGGNNVDAGPPIITRPNPIISRVPLAQVFSSPAGGAAVRDGVYHAGAWNAGTPTDAAPAWVALKLAAGPTRVLVSWDDGGTYNYQDPATQIVYGLPAAYHIDVSPDSTNGVDGTWTAKATVDRNVVRTRAHSMDFAGMTWVKMVITATPANESGNGVQIGEIDVHDISATGGGLPDDTWFFMGDSITAYAYDRAAAQAPSFADLIHTATTPLNFSPAMINGGIGGELSRDGLARLAGTLTLNPDYRFFVLGYGTNDSAGMQASPAVFGTNMQAMIDMVKAGGQIPVLPHIPYSDDGNHGGIPAYNTVIDQLTATNQLPLAGPDFYGYFMAHPDQLMQINSSSGMVDKLHPTDVGQAAMNKLFADAARPLYP
jgi:acyl-CoA thioesterase-1